LVTGEDPDVADFQSGRGRRPTFPRPTCPSSGAERGKPPKQRIAALIAQNGGWLTESLPAPNLVILDKTGRAQTVMIKG
jgi:hypothetical protein